jgi:hypothetical protein
MNNLVLGLDKKIGKREGLLYSFLEDSFIPKIMGNKFLFVKTFLIYF